MQIKVLGISGSPRIQGSMFLLDFALRAAKEANPEAVNTELYSLSGKTIEPCDSCHQCYDIGFCVHEDDDAFGELRDKWLAADVVIYSVPVYHMCIPAQLKAFIDRVGHSVQESFNDRAMKVMGVITSGSGFASGQEAVMQFLNNHAIMEGCIPVGGLWPVGYIGVGARAGSPAAIQELYEKDDEHIVEAIEAIKKLSEQIIIVATLIKSGGEQNKQMLKNVGGFEFFLRRIENNKQDE